MGHEKEGHMIFHTLHYSLKIFIQNYHYPFNEWVFGPMVKELPSWGKGSGVKQAALSTSHIFMV